MSCLQSGDVNFGVKCIIASSAQTPPFGKNPVRGPGIAAAYESKNERRVRQRMPRIEDV